MFSDWTWQMVAIASSLIIGLGISLRYIFGFLEKIVFYKSLRDVVSDMIAVEKNQLIDFIYNEGLRIVLEGVLEKTKHAQKQRTKKSYTPRKKNY